MMTSEQLAREIIDMLNEHEHASYEEAIELVAKVVAPLVSDTERWRAVSDRCQIGDRPERYRCNICGGIVSFDGIKPKDQL